MAIVEYVVQSGDTLSGIAPKLGYKDWEELRDANLAEILRVGRSQMAGRIGADVTRGPPCGLSEHTNPIYSSHLIIGGIHYDAAGSPTIYPGTTLFLKSKTEPPEEEPETLEEDSGKESKKSGNGRIGAKTYFPNSEQEEFASFNVEYQSPQPRIEIIKPDGDIVELKPAYAGVAAGGNAIISQNLLSYTFSEAVDDLMGSFSFSVANEMSVKPTSGNPGKSLFDLIPRRSVVNIYEYNDTIPAFRGIIRKRHIGATMTSSGVQKSAIFSGKSIISCITEFMVPLDFRIPKISNAIPKTKTLQSKLGQDEMTIKKFMQETWDFFRQVSDDVSKKSGLVNGRLLEIIDDEQFIGKDFIQETGTETNLQYPVATMFYNQTNNYITDVWRNILPKPAYELFTRFDEEKKKPVIVARQAPFGNPGNRKDWLDLTVYPIEPVSLTSYDLEQSDEEVYTAFNSYVIGSPKAKEFYQVVSDKVDTAIQINEEKAAMYGFKLLSVSFMGFDRMLNENAETKRNDLDAALRKLNERTAYWFSRLDEMYSGTITLITNLKDRSKNPKAGCRVSFLGGQFYVEKSEHSWNYGKTPINKLTVSRGMVYDAHGSITEEI